MQATSSHNKIVIIFETSNYNPDSLDYVIKLASSLDAAIHGLYIEDLDLLTAVELPFVREITHHTANVRNIDSQLIAQQLHNYSEKIRYLLQSQALISSVTVTFSSIRGRRLSTIDQQIDQAELVFLPARKFSSGSIQTIKKHDVDGSIAVVFDETASAEQCMRTAISLAVATGIGLQVFSRTSEISILLDQFNIKYSVIKADAHQTTQLVKLLNEYAPKLILLPSTSQLLQQEFYLKRHINPFAYDIMIVR